METPKLPGRVIIGLVLVILGGLAVLHNLNIVDLSDYPISWEYFFIVGGLLFFLFTNNKTVGIVFLSLGLFSLVPELWPLVLVMIGLYIIFGRGGRIKNYSSKAAPDSETNSNDYFECVNIFGGGNKVLHTDNFRGGNIVSIFGGCELHLDGCKLAPGENVIEITAIFGGGTILVPTDWNIIIDVLPIFGGFGDKRIKDPNLVYQTDRTLHIKGVALFGGGEVKTAY